MRLEHRIFHLADLHLGVSVGRGKLPLDARGAIGESRNSTVRRIMQRAKDEEIGSVAIAGDVFHTPDAQPGLALEFADACALADPVPVVICTGNHDYYKPGGVWDSIWWPENVVTFKNPAMSRYTLQGLAVTYWGWGWDAPEIKVSPFCGQWPTDFPAPGLNIALGHGSLLDAQPPDWKQYAPFWLDNLPKKGLDYVALGHLHWHSQLWIQERTPAIYPGSPVGTGFDDPGQKYYVDATIDEDGCKITPTSSSGAEFRQRVIHTDEIHTKQDLIDAILTVDGASRGRTVDFVEVVGLVSDGLKDAMPGIYQFCKGKFLHLSVHDFTFQTSDGPDMGARAENLERFVEGMNAAIEDEPDEERRKLLEKVREHGLVAANARTPGRRGTLYQ